MKGVLLLLSVAALFAACGGTAALPAGSATGNSTPPAPTTPAASSASATASPPGTESAGDVTSDKTVEEQPPPRNTELWVVTEGAGQNLQGVPFENGTAVQVGDVNVELFIAPYPPAREGSIDLLVTDQAGSPVESGDLNILFDMDMPHGSIQAEALPAGAGHYLIPYLLVMPGTWQVGVTISSADAVRSLAFVFKVN